ncbi:hypothetical protein AK812_SmicGene15874 [Symbiodinium microadriaticum]|uniref:mTERF domain-containing protein 1, mitochondrial n=1 Tax=Symbiodinium microadriaticum TaxID=2951 RepID=A0A1Q9E1V1_SYMMI|nr:hypothetical protein AK812_SmicGene15874 [Symbiodinium microadriaticum]
MPTSDSAPRSLDKYVRERARDLDQGRGRQPGRERDGDQGRNPDLVPGKSLPMRVTDRANPDTDPVVTVQFSRLATGHFEDYVRHVLVMRDSNRDQAYAMCALFCHFKSWSDAWAFCLLKQRKQEIDGVAWAATLGFPRAYLARGAEIAETEQRAITLKQLKVHSWQSCPGVPLASVDAILKQAQQKNKFTVSSGKFLRDHKGKEVDWNSVPWVWASEQFFDWALLMEQADLHLDDIELLEAREQRLDEEGGYVNLYVINDCIAALLASGEGKVELLSQLAVLLMPDEPIAEAFRDFPVPKSKEWGSSRLCPDFSAYGVLKRAGAALFIEYDGYYRHMEPQGLRRDVRKTSALLKFAPAGSVVLRIAHKERPWKDKSVQVLVDCWQSEHVPSLHKTVEQFVASLLQSCRTELVPGLVSRLEVRVPPQIDKHAKTFAMDAELVGNASSTNRLALQEFLRKKMQLSTVQVAKSIVRFPSVLGLSIEANLKPTVEWIKGLGLSPSQVAKVITSFPQVLGLSIEANLKPTVEWIKGLGLSQSQVAKVIATFPAVLGLSMEANLKPTVEWIKGLGLSQSQVAKVIATFPQVLGLNVESNLRVKYVLIESFFPGAAAAELLARAPSAFQAFRRHDVGVGCIQPQIHKFTAADTAENSVWLDRGPTVVPFTLRFRCSFVELVAEGPQLPRSKLHTGFPTDHYLLVTEAYPTKRDFYEKWRREQRQLSEASPYWICTFANNQHDLSSFLAEMLTWSRVSFVYGRGFIGLSGTLRQTPFVRAILSDDCVGDMAQIWCVLENFVSTVWAREAGEYLYDIAAWLPVGSALHGGRPAKPTLRLDFGRSQAREVVDDEATGGAFPLQVAARGACVNISLAKASREEDKRKILHLIAGTAEEDWAQPPPEECEAFDSMNGRVRRMFAAGALYRAALQNDAAELKRSTIRPECRSRVDQL